jgi:hypothetical protein
MRERLPEGGLVQGFGVLIGVWAAWFFGARRLGGGVKAGRRPPRGAFADAVYVGFESADASCDGVLLGPVSGEQVGERSVRSGSHGASPSQLASIASDTDP